MKRLNSLWFCIILIVFSACSSDGVNTENTLAQYVKDKNIEVGGVIACAASDKTTGDIFAFFYPEPGATNIKYYETENSNFDKNDYGSYFEVKHSIVPVFNGYLGRFTHNAQHEKWIIVTFELDGDIKISNPIRSKQLSKPTLWNGAVTIEQSQSTMPFFYWVDNPVGDNAIYFQVVTDDENNLLSGTYTHENTFQYYNTSNVILNVTRNTPPNLIIGNTYNFTLMDVSKDNWVNWVVEKTFEAK
ncbi:hypothetical protein ABI125_15920 [Tamlana crocina]